MQEKKKKINLKYDMIMIYIFAKTTIESLKNV